MPKGYVKFASWHKSTAGTILPCWNFSNTKVHWRTCSHYRVQTFQKQKFWIVAYCLVKHVNRIFRIRLSQLCCKQDSDQDQDSYFLDQDWSRTQKNLSPNTSVSKMNGVKFFKSDPTIFFKTPKLIVLKFISCLNPKSDHWYQPSGYIQSTQERNF